MKPCGSVKDGHRSVFHLAYSGNRGRLSRKETPFPTRAHRYRPAEFWTRATRSRSAPAPGVATIGGASFTRSISRPPSACRCMHDHLAPSKWTPPSTRRRRSRPPCTGLRRRRRNSSLRAKPRAKSHTSGGCAIAVNSSMNSSAASSRSAKSSLQENQYPQQKNGAR